MSGAERDWSMGWRPDEDISSVELDLLAAGGYEYRLAEHPGLGVGAQEVLLALALAAYPNQPELLVRLSANPGATSEVLDAAWDASTGEAQVSADTRGERGWWSVRAALGGNPALESARQWDLLEEVPAALASNAALDPGVREVLEASDDDGVVLALACRHDLSVSAQVRLAADNRVQWELVGNPSLVEEARAVLARHAHYSALRMMGLRGMIKLDEHLALTRSSDVHRRCVAAESGPAQVAEALVQDRATNVRRALAGNARTPDEVLLTLSADRAMWPVLAGRARIPDEVGEVLLGGSTNVLRTLVQGGSRWAERALEVSRGDSFVWRVTRPCDFPARGWMPGWWAVHARGADELIQARGLDVDDVLVLSDGFDGAFAELLDVASELT